MVLLTNFYLLENTFLPNFPSKYNYGRVLFVQLSWVKIVQSNYSRIYIRRVSDKWDETIRTANKAWRIPIHIKYNITNLIYKLKPGSKEKQCSYLS